MSAPSGMTELHFEMLDVFTDQQLEGIQFPVFLHADGLNEETMQAIAREFLVSETSFLFDTGNENHALMRLFTTMVELPFAGHPSLGSAIAIARSRFPQETQVEIRLETKAGVIPVAVTQTDDRYEGWMTQPSPVITPWGNGEELLKMLKLTDAEVPLEVFDNGVKHIFVMANHVEEVVELVPNYEAFLRVVGDPCVNIAAIDDNGDYFLRTFVFGDALPAEEPACGSAAGSLAVKLLRDGRTNAGSVITIRQGQCISRPSTIFAAAEATSDTAWNVQVGGSAVFVGSGVLHLRA